jgi:hypothetical protein
MSASKSTVLKSGSISTHTHTFWEILRTQWLFGQCQLTYAGHNNVSTEHCSTNTFNLCTLLVEIWYVGVSILMALIVISWNNLICVFEYSYASTSSCDNCGLFQWLLLVHLQHVGDEWDWMGIPQAGAVWTGLQSRWLYGLQCELTLYWIFGEYQHAVKLQYICNSSCSDFYVCVCPE